MSNIAARVYHGTNTGALTNILLTGIKPRGNTPSVWPEDPSKSEFVYLGVGYSIHYAYAASTKTDVDPVLIEVDTSLLHPDYFGPDEDFLALYFQSLKSQGKPVPPEISDTDDYKVIRERLHPRKYPHFWQGSMENMGNITYYGDVPPEAITRYVTINQQNCPCLYHIGSKHVDLRSYRDTHTFYKSLIKFLFDDVPLRIESVRTPDGDSKEFLSWTAQVLSDLNIEKANYTSVTTL